jgi:hypothetical protein
LRPAGSKNYPRALGPRALLLIRGSKVAPCGVQQPPQSTRAPKRSYGSGVRRLRPAGSSNRPRTLGPPSPPTDQGFEGCALRGPATALEHSGPRALLLIRGSEVAPCGVQQPPQSTRAPRPLLIRGSRAGPSEGFDSRPRALRLRAHY